MLVKAMMMLMLGMVLMKLMLMRWVLVRLAMMMSRTVVMLMAPVIRLIKRIAEHDVGDDVVHSGDDADDGRVAC